MATTAQPISDATINIYHAEEYGVTGPILTADPKDGKPGFYKADDVDEGDYTYLVSAPGKGSVVGDFTLPGPDGNLQKNIPPITLVSGVDVNLTLTNRFDQPLLAAGEGGPTGPSGPTGVEVELEVKIARLYAEGGGEGVYTIDNVPIGERLIEVKRLGENVVEEETTNLQNISVLRTISAANKDISIKIYPPVVLYVLVNKDVGGKITVDTTCRLWRVASNGFKIQEITSKSGNHFRIPNLSDGTMYFQVYGSDGNTPLGDQQEYSLSWVDSTNNSIFKVITYFAGGVGGS